MRIVSWNMNYGRRSDQARRDAWTFLRDELRTDLVLAQEASPPPGTNAVYRAIDDNNKNFRWGSAIVALNPALTLKGRIRVPAPECFSRAPEAEELPDTHPGACAVADVLDGAGRRLFTAVSLYGSLEGMPGGSSYYGGPRLHRILSDLTGVLVRAYRDPVLLAGDFNVSTQDGESPENEAAAVFARLRAWDMVDCVARTRADRPRLANCSCPDGDSCSHVRTFRNGNRADSWAKQLDYAFVSEPVVGALSKCQVLDEEAAVWKLSDHCPILLDLNIEGQ
jgi:endonuclease/exonuclease/phosphatase family metal-dependent hydrolase